MTTPHITYNPGILGDEELIRSFVVRKESLELVLETLRENAASPAANRHLLVVGPRGIGKTMLVRRAAAEVRANPTYGSQWYALVFGEESYAVSTSGEFWLDALFHLAEQTQDERWKRAWGELRDERDERRLYHRALAQLMDFADRENRRLLLVVENLNMLLGDQLTPESAWELRHTLAHEPRVMLLGTAISRFEEIANADRAWFEMFSIHELKPLDQPECGVLWLSATNVPLGSGPLRAIRILTGGNPRLLAILASFAASRSFRQLMDQLVRLVDDRTEYFKSHLDSLAVKERKVFVALLEHWDPVGAAELARLTRLAANEVSALLGRLLKRGAVEVVEQKGRRKLYQAAERLYNIYYLMRRRGHPTGRVRAAVNFMVVFYEGEELAEEAEKVWIKALELHPELSPCAVHRKQGKWEEALEMSRPVLDAAVGEENARRAATEFLIQAAAAGHARAALERLTGSPGLAALEPLAIGLRIYAGETPTAAKEVLEVGQDVAERIRQRRKG